MSKSFNFSEFYDTEVSIISNDMAVDSGFALTSARSVRTASLMVSLQHSDGNKNDFLGTPAIQSTHWAACADEQTNVVNGDLMLRGTTYYEIKFSQYIHSHMGGYHMFLLDKVEQ